MALTTNFSYKVWTTVILGTEWTKMLELLAPINERYNENSLYWQTELTKAVSVLPTCNPCIRVWLGAGMFYTIQTMNL